MSKSTTSATPNKVNRTVRLICPPTSGCPGRLSMTIDGEATEYLLIYQDSDIGGVAFYLGKVEGDKIVGRYNVLIHGSSSTCDCKDMTYRGHRRPCKHIAALTALLKQRKLR